MKKKHGLELLREQTAYAAEVFTTLRYEKWEKLFESPIEALFFTALRNAISVGFAPSLSHTVIYIKTPKKREKTKENILCVERQVQIGSYRVDFLIWCPLKPERMMVVECDGHDFHERTKEQAAKDRSRDRALQSQGYEVFRFTGSELYRDPLGCAQEVARILEKWATEA